MKPLNLLNLICGLFIILFVYTAASKLIDFAAFRIQMSRQPLPSMLRSILTWLLPPSEIAIAAFLLFERTRLTGLWLSGFAMLVFTFYVALAVSGAFDQRPCSCGGVIKSMTWNQHLGFNIFFLLLSVPGIVIASRERRCRQTAQQ